MAYHDIILRWKSLASRLNRRGFVLEMPRKLWPTLVVAGYTRSGTTYLAGILSSILKARYIHEPLNPDSVKEVSFFHPRESATTILKDAKYIAALRSVFGPGFKGEKEHGCYVFYRGNRVVKEVRANFYLHVLSRLFPETRFCVIIRNPLSAIASRIRLKWEVPDHSRCLSDIEHKLSFEQQKVIKSATTIHERLAISWCLDNMALLNNVDNRQFEWIFYENLVLEPVEQIKKVLKTVSQRIPDKRIISEIDLYSASAPRETAGLVRSWEGELNTQEVKDVLGVVEIFALSYLYDLESGLPKHSFPGDG